MRIYVSQCIAPRTSASRLPGTSIIEYMVSKRAQPNEKQPASEPAPILPVAALRAYATAVEDGIALVLAAPEKRAIHKLRTATRRVEAQLELLDALQAGQPGPEQDGKAAAKAKKVHKLLAKVRKDAGHVRDFDVQLDLVEEALNGNAGDALQAESNQLCAWLNRRRTAAAGTLLHALDRHASQLAPRIEALIQALHPALHQNLSRPRLLALTRQWHAERTRGLAGPSDGRSDGPPGGKRGEQALHDRRKAAKVARYLLETAGPGGGLRKAAAAYEAVQESGGAWHDNLVLRQIAAKRLGKHAHLAVLFAQREQAALVAFKQHLEAKPHAGKTERQRPAGMRLPKNPASS